MRSGKLSRSVLQLAPQVAAFDCDGTLWAGNAGQRFFYWEIERGLIWPELAAWSLNRYSGYLDRKVTEEEICQEMVSIHQGLSSSELEALGRDFFNRFVASHVYPEMVTLIQGLQAQQAEVWLVSSTNCWVIGAAAEWLGVRRDRVIAATAALEGDRVSDRVVRVPTGGGKAACFRELAGRDPDAAFGNTEHDLALLQMARFPYAVNPDEKLLRLARIRGWPVCYLAVPCS